MVTLWARSIHPKASLKLNPTVEVAWEIPPYYGVHMVVEVGGKGGVSIQGLFATSSLVVPFFLLQASKSGPFPAIIKLLSELFHSEISFKRSFHNRDVSGNGQPVNQ